MKFSAAYSAFYAWWIQVCIILVGVYWLWYEGILKIIYHDDITHLTQVIAFLAVIGIARIGWLSWKFGYLVNRTLPIRFNHVKEKMRKHIEEWREMSIMFMQIGLVGTIVSFAYLAYSVLGTIDIQAGFDAVKLVPPLLTGLGTVFFTTAVGIASAIIIQLQTMLFNSFTGIDDYKYKGDSK